MKNKKVMLICLMTILSGCNILTFTKTSDVDARKLEALSFEAGCVIARIEHGMHRDRELSCKDLANSWVKKLGEE